MADNAGVEECPGADLWGEMLAGNIKDIAIHKGVLPKIVVSFPPALFITRLHA